VQGAEEICELAGAGSGGGMQFIDCDKIDGLPEVLFHIAGRQFKLTGQDYVLQVPSPHPCFATPPTATKHSDTTSVSLSRGSTLPYSHYLLSLHTFGGCENAMYYFKYISSPQPSAKVVFEILQFLNIYLSYNSCNMDRVELSGVVFA
jgi:hypothetical protein